MKNKRENEKICEGQEEESNEIYFLGTWSDGRIISSRIGG